jgi:cell division protein FtsI (penicillin-binding protein 3)
MIILILFFLFGVDSILSSKRSLPRKIESLHDRALRGAIVSKHGFRVARSTKRYEAKIYPLSLDPNKEELFIKLFSIYSGIEEETLKKKIYTKDGKKRRGYVTLTKNIDVRTSIFLKDLSRKLRRLKVFRPILNSKRESILYGLDIIEIGEVRQYPFGDTLSPIIGYVRSKPISIGEYKDLKSSFDNSNINIFNLFYKCLLDQNLSIKQIVQKEANATFKRLYGVKGLEQKYNKNLLGRVDGILEGKKDIAKNAIISSLNSKIGKRVDGLDLHLNIDMNLQKRVEIVLDTIEEKIRAKEIIAAVMDSKTGEILAIATTQRYNPNRITKGDIPKLQPKFTEYLYEPGSVIKPITLSIAFELGYVTPETVINTHNGILPLTRRYRIRDDEPFKTLTATDIIVHSSNIGITEIVWKMSAKEFWEGLKKFELGNSSGVDLPRDLKGKIKSLKRLKNRVDKANQSYGYGMQLTFMQLLKAYSTFNNEGIEVTPRIVNYLKDPDNPKIIYKVKRRAKRVISKDSALKIKKILIEVVKRGTGKAARVEGLEIGGKTGTAHIYDFNAKRYVERYNSSFFGFANDKEGNKFTIGVLVIDPTRENKYYFASKSAVPVFHDIVENLKSLDYLKPTLSAEQQKELDKIKQKKREISMEFKKIRTRNLSRILEKQRKIGSLKRRQKRSTKTRTKKLKNILKKIKKHKKISKKKMLKEHKIDQKHLNPKKNTSESRKLKSPEEQLF